MKKLLLFLPLLALGCKDGLLDAGGQKLYSKVDLRDAVQISSGAVTLTALPQLQKMGVVEVPRIDVRNTFKQEKPFVAIDRVTVFESSVPKGCKKTVTYTKMDGKTRVTEVTVIEPAPAGQQKEIPIERLIIAIMGTILLFLAWMLYLERKLKKE